MARTKAKALWLGFDSLVMCGDGKVPPGATAELMSRPQIPFRGERLFVYRPCASSFLIQAIQAGLVHTTANNRSIPADAFSTNMDKMAEVDKLFTKDQVFHMEVNLKGSELLGSPWTLPLVQPGVDIYIVVENIGGEPLRFIGGFLGRGT